MNSVFHDGVSSFSDQANYARIHDRRKDTYLKCLETRLITCINTMQKDKELTVVDFGTNDGGNILATFQSFSRYIKEKRPGQNIKFIFNDIDPDIVELLDRKIKAVASNLVSEPHVHIETNINDCYKECLPNKSVDIAFCMFVLHWLSRPCTIRNGIFWLDADHEELKVIRTIAEEDWKSFLNSRSSELKSGGYVITVFPGFGNQEYHTASRKVFREMQQRNEISQEEVKLITVNYYCDRTLSDIKKPFLDGSIKDLNLLDVHYNTILLRDMGITPDRAGELHRTLLFHSVMNGLSNNRTRAEKQQICDLFFDRIHLEVVNSKDSFKNCTFTLYECLIEKQ